MTTLNQIIEDGIEEFRNLFFYEKDSEDEISDKDAMVLFLRTFAEKIWKEAHQEGRDSIKGCSLQGYRATREEVIGEIEQGMEKANGGGNWRRVLIQTLKGLKEGGK